MCQPFVAVCRHTTTTHDSALGPHNHLEITRSLNFQNLPGDLRTTRVCRTTTDGRQQRTRTTTDNTDTTVPYSTPRRTTHRPRAQGELPNRRHSSCGPDDDRDSTRLAVHPTWRSHAVRGDSIRAHGTRAGCARLSLDGIWTDIPLSPTTRQMRDNTTEGAQQRVAHPRVLRNQFRDLDALALPTHLHGPGPGRGLPLHLAHGRA